MRIPLILGLSLALNALTVLAENQIYQWQEQNKTHFSDQPHPNAKLIQVNNGYSFYQVKRVMDGDTLQLDDDIKVRLSSINTPEIGGRYRMSEAGGDQAKRWLIEQVQGQKVRLITDSELEDKYHRRLAHVFTESGRHINLELVSNGFASVNIFPPNLKYATELLQAEQQAEQQQLGIWHEPAYAVKTIGDLQNQPLTGWQRLSGTATDIHQTSRYFYLNFSESFSIRIARDNLALFPALNTYLGHQLEVRGWVNQQQNGYSMLIRHPHAIKIIR